LKNEKSMLSLILLLAIASSFLFTSCDKEGSSPKSILMGEKWKLKGFETEDAEYAEIFNAMFALVNVTYEFEKDGVYVVKASLFGFGESESDRGTWSISDDGKELTLDGEVSEIKELTKKVLKLGPNKSVMGDYSEGEDGVDTFTDYAILFEAK